MKKRSLQVLVLKAFRHQNPPIIVIQDSNQSNNKIIFGGLSEPSLRYLDFYRINPFQEGQAFFLTRSSVNYLDGISPLVLQSFSRNKFLGITFFGPDGLCEYVVKLYQLIGVRFLIYGAMDIPSGIFKLGIKHLHAFTDQIRKGKSLLDLMETRNIEVKATNQYLSKLCNKLDLQDPSLMVLDGCIKSKSFCVYPIENSKNKKVLSYYVTAFTDFKWDTEKLQRDKFPHPFIPELGSRSSFFCHGRTYRKEDYQILGKRQSILILDLLPDEIESFDIDTLIKLVNNEESLLIIHTADKASLQSEIYEQLISVMEQSIGITCKLVHVILDDTFITNLNVDTDRDKVLFTNVDFTNKLNKLLPQIFPQIQLDHNGRLPDQTSLDDLWSTLKVQKILTRKSLALEIENGQISFEKVYRLGAPQIIITDQEKNQMLQAYSSLNLQAQEMRSRFKITFLGTSATVPTKHSNVQSFMVSVDQTKILVDCGSNTFYQLFCAFGVDLIKTVLKEIKIIYISHFHGDHHLGLIQLLTKRLELIDEDIEPLNIMVPFNLTRWYSTLLSQLVKDLRPGKNANDFFNLFLNDNLQKSLNHQPSQYKKVINILDTMQISLTPFPVKHCFYSTGVQIKDLQTKQSIVFSCDRDGSIDMKENKEFLTLSQDCDILVHECTFPDTQMDKAKLVTHSTFSQAIQTGLEVNAKTLVLAHYTSPCVNYIQRLINKDGQFNKDLYETQLRAISSDIKFSCPQMLDYMTNRTVFSTDLMSVHTSDLKNMPHLSRLIISTQSIS